MIEGCSRRRFLGRAIGAGAATVLALESRASQDEPPARVEPGNFITPDVQRVIDRGLLYLANTQNRDGSFGDRINFHGSVAITSLAGLALMSAGDQPGRGRFGGNVQRALLYVLSREKRTAPVGFLHNEANSRQVGMYDHGFGTLFLAELDGMVPDLDLQRRLKEAIQRAVGLIESTQNDEGGWRYEPVKMSADISVTICQIMALRAARNAGFAVNKRVVDLCLKYVRSCQAADGGYSYVSGPGESGFARSAAGLVALYSAGVYEGKELDRTLKYLIRFKPNLELSRRAVPDMHWFYGQYYAAQAMWTAALRQPQYWNDWFPAIRDELMWRARSRNDGAWQDAMTCNHYATAMALIILQIPNNYLPILQK